MELEKSLGNSKKHCERVVDWIGSNEKRFADLMRLFFNGEPRVRQLAAWPMSYAVINHPELVRPWLGAIVEQLEKKDFHPALIRNILRLLPSVKIPKAYQGPVMNACFEFIQSPVQPAAIKAFALTVLEKFSSQYPEILPELKLIIEERWNIEKAAFRVRAKRILMK